ncbi:MAG: alanine:cation symporter family protein [Ruminococcaceae bacterium]|nr:alanine:cation symporter family protein [Oscillospiraceae bacterium]
MIESVNGILNGKILPLLLLAAGLFYAFRLRFFPITRLPVILRVLTRRSEKGGVSSFRSLTLALAGTLGVGNIVGVASAIALGGVGAIFWMWVSALAAMLLKYAEVVLGLRYRKRASDGWHGGAPYYIREGLAKRGRQGLGTGLALLFALLCILDSFTTGSSIQAAAVSSALSGVMGVSPTLSGLLLAIACAMLLMKGAGAVMRVTELLVPVMCGGFLFLSVWCMAVRPAEILPALARIFREAFSPECALYGVGGFLFSGAVRYGTMRGLLSNEAGCGTSPFAHAAADARCPTEQGFFGIFEVFVDTVLLCTVTAIVIIMNWESASAFSDDPMMLAIRAYSASFGGVWATLVEGFLGVSILCFGFATLLCWAHYGLECIGFLSKRKICRTLYIYAFAASILWGATAVVGAVWSVADLVIGLMILLHVPLLCVFSGEVLTETGNYFGGLPKKKK